MHVMRPKRLTRPKARPAFRLTDRDATIVEIVGAYQVASSDQIYRYLCIDDPTTSQQKVTRRLAALFAHVYVGRPLQQHLQIGSLAPLLYTLDRKGLRLLAQRREAAIDPRAEWKVKASRTASAPFLQHALGITETMLAFRRACAERRGLRLVDQPELIASFIPEETRALQHPLRLRMTVKDGLKSVPISLVADRVFSIVYADATRHNYLLEYDRGSMSIAARRLTKSSFGKKIKGYLAAYDQQRHRTQLGFERLRILTVTTSEARIRAMLEAQRAITNGRVSGMFLYSTAQRIAEHGAFGPAWITTQSDNVVLLEGAA